MSMVFFVTLSKLFNVAFNRLIIYYHSGTGNALIAGRWAINIAHSLGLKTELYSIDHDYQPNLSDVDENTLIGFHFPTHGFSLSPAMFKFIRKFPKQMPCKVYLLNTRAGGKFFKFFVPGLSGAAQLLPMFLLRIKGYTLQGALPLDLPSNWISLHPGLGPKMVQSIVERRKLLVDRFMRKILADEREFWRSLIYLPIDIMVLPIAVLYFFIGRFFLAKTFVHTHKCTDCNLCVEECPVGAIKLVGGKPYWTYKCESCMRCINICPHKAIQTSHLLAFIGVLIAQVGFTFLIMQYVPWLNCINSTMLIFIIDSSLMLAFFFLIYFILQKLFKYKGFGRLLELSSFTYYWRRYLFPGVKAKDFHQKN